MAPSVLEDRIEAFRRFNRFFTRRIGVLRPGLYDSPYSLAEVRVLYELAHGKAHPTATELGHELDLDPGYLSRIVRSFEAAGLVRRARANHDGRQFHLALTAAGRKAFAPLDQASHDEIGALLAPLPDDAQRHMASAMDTIESLLGDEPPEAQASSLRPPRPGDMGWVIQRHGALYAQEYGLDATFEALVGEIAARFVRRFDPAGDRAWIAEHRGINVGFVLVVRRAPTVAQLRLLLVEPSARGLGIGGRLVDEAIAFARGAGYRKLMLWTNAGLDAARHLYDARGFRLVREEPHHSFGRDLVGQTMELRLSYAVTAK